MLRGPHRAGQVALLAAIGGCGGGSSPDPGTGPGPGPPVRGAIEVAAADRLPLALSARAGYGGVAVVARSGSAATVRGRIRPRDSRVSVLDTRSGRRVRARVDEAGAFAATLTGVRPGASAVIVSGARRGRLRWAQNLLLVRPGAGLDPPATVVVPPLDRTPPVAILALDRVRAFIPGQSTPDRPVVLRDTVLRARGLTRDADGGALRIRLTVTATVRCEERDTGRVRSVPRLWRRPPAAIERLFVPPGRTLPTTLRRGIRVDLAGSACRRDERLRGVDGQVEADATNATELEEATPIYFRIGR